MLIQEIVIVSLTQVSGNFDINIFLEINIYKKSIINYGKKNFSSR
jgi:hypothetical protein